MKSEVKIIMKEKGKLDLFTEQRYSTVKNLCKIAMEQNIIIKLLIMQGRFYKSPWIADNLIHLVESGNLK
jgi:hypothetical protein